MDQRTEQQQKKIPFAHANPGSIMKTPPSSKFVCLTVALLALGLAQAVQAGDGKSMPVQMTPAVDWLEFAISPVSNPIFFEDPRIRTEVRLVFLYNRVGDDFGLRLPGGDLNLGGADIYAYGAQIRYAITPRLAIIATNDVGIYFEPDHPIEGTGFQKFTGYSDLDVGFKYALVDSPEHQFLFTPILTYAIPTGARRVFQGDNSGIFDVAFSTEKGFDKFHLIGNAGVRIPVDTDRNSTSLHYSLHADYYISRYFIPLVEFNGWTVLDSPSGRKGPLGVFNTAVNTEGADLINFGASNLEGNTQAAIGVGFRSKLCKNVDFGFIYEHTVTSPRGAFEQRVTTDLIIHF